MLRSVNFWINLVAGELINCGWMIPISHPLGNNYSILWVYNLVGVIMGWRDISPVRGFVC